MARKGTYFGPLGVWRYRYSTLTSSARPSRSLSLSLSLGHSACLENKYDYHNYYHEEGRRRCDRDDVGRLQASAVETPDRGGQRLRSHACHRGRGMQTDRQTWQHYCSNCGEERPGREFYQFSLANRTRIDSTRLVIHGRTTPARGRGEHSAADNIKYAPRAEQRCCPSPGRFTCLQRLRVWSNTDVAAVCVFVHHIWTSADPTNFLLQNTSQWHRTSVNTPERRERARALRELFTVQNLPSARRSALAYCPDSF